MVETGVQLDWTSLEASEWLTRRVGDAKELGASMSSAASQLILREKLGSGLPPRYISEPLTGSWPSIRISNCFFAISMRFSVVYSRPDEG
jgi:hypothetical protein